MIINRSLYKSRIENPIPVSFQRLLFCFKQASGYCSGTCRSISQNLSGHGFDFVDLKKGDEYGIEEFRSNLWGMFCHTAESTGLTLAVTVQYS